MLLRILWAEQARLEIRRGLRSFLPRSAGSKLGARRRIRFRRSQPIPRARAVLGRTFLLTKPRAAVHALSALEALQREWSWARLRLRMSAKTLSNRRSVRAPHINFKRRRVRHPRRRRWLQLKTRKLR